MKLVFALLLIATVALGAYLISASIIADYQYSREIQSYWNLADKASTLEQKAIYLDQFVAAIEKSGLHGNNALIFTTPDNSYDQNMIALKSLQGRMHEIQKMDVQSFQYQQAIQQITQQEQGEASHMLGVFEGIWYLNHYRLLWDWIGCIAITLGLVLLCATIIVGMIAFGIKFAL
jgi:hypothetical protein